jgi:tripartite-type tricarboxylate transporter receptor subunit TctC
MSISRLVLGTVSASVIVLSAGMAGSQTYPTKPIRIVTANAGGGNDIMARLIAQGISGPLGQPVIVDNRGGGIFTADLVSKAPADGYTLLAHSNSVWIGPLLQKTPYDPVADLAPIVAMAKAPNILVVHPSVTASSVKELIALAKVKPGELNYASGPTGGGSHLSAELLKYMAGVDIVRIAYKGGAAALVDVMAGRVQMTFDDIPTLMPNVKAGKLRALAVTSAEPSALAPGLPTMTASGVPGYVSDSTQGLWAPAKSPPGVIRRLNQEVVRLINQADVKEKFFSNGVEPVAGPPEQFGSIIKSDMDSLGKVIKAAGIKSE